MIFSGTACVGNLNISLQKHTVIQLFCFKYLINHINTIIVMKLCQINKAIVDIKLRSRCALPSPQSRAIGRAICAQNFPDSYLRLPCILNDPFCYMTLLASEWPLSQQTRYNSLSLRRTTHKIDYFPRYFVTLPDKDRAMAIGNTHKQFGADRLCGSGDMLADRQIDRQT